MTDDEQDMATAAAEPAPVRKKGRGKLLVLAVVVLVVGAGTAGGGWWWKSRAQSAAHGEGTGREGEKGEHGSQIGEDSGVLQLEPFTVNLADKDASRFLRTSIHLVIDEGEKAEELEKDKLKVMRIRSAVLEVLTVQTSDRIVTPEGKAALKHAIVEKTSVILKPIKVIDVLFSDLVVQF